MYLADAFTKAGAFIAVGDRFAFAMGPNGAGTHLGIVRIGGHREGYETSWECVSREAMEEAGVSLLPITPETTYRLTCFHHRMEYAPYPWESSGPPPLLVAGEKGTPITILYLARTEDNPQPSAETKGIALLTPEEINTVCTTPLTLGQFREKGGIYITKENYAPDAPIRPGWHIRAFNDLLTRYLRMK